MVQISRVCSSAVLTSFNAWEFYLVEYPFLHHDLAVLMIHIDLPVAILRAFNRL